jgi:hypothetical protein
MSPRSVTLVVLLLLSVCMGVALGEWFYRLYLSAIPPVGQSQFNAGASHMVHLVYGAGVGVVLFLWALLGMAAGRLLGMTTKPATPAAR